MITQTSSAETGQGRELHGSLRRAHRLAVEYMVFQESSQLALSPVAAWISYVCTDFLLKNQLTL